LEESFSVLYSIAYAKDASVIDCLELSRGSNIWNISFTRAVHNWKIDVFTLFFYLLYSLRLRQGGEDKLLGSFQVRDV
jgi:hypothetical protein